MKLTSTLRLKTSLEKTTKVISEDCSLGQAITMIESWCYDNGADYPRTCDLWKTDGNIRVQITTKDNKYINIFDITDNNRLVMKEQIEEMWKKYNAFKKTAEQHDFIKLIMLDAKFIPAYKDLKKNWNEDHAKKFINGMNIVFNELGIK